MAEEKKEIVQTMEYSNSIGGRKKPVPGTDEGKDLPRNLEARGLRTATPFPNIVRIEQLDGDSRNRYSSGITNIIDSLHAKAENGRIGGIQKEVFYGFMKAPPSDQKITINWQKRGGVSEVISGVTGAAAAGIGGVTNFLANRRVIQGSTAAGITNSVQSLANAATAGFNMISSIDTLMGELAGINSSIVGQNTIRRVKDVSMQSFSITCSWYLPEQYALFCKGIRSLFRIAYPNEVSIGDVINGDLKEKISKIVKDSRYKSSSGPEADSNSGTDYEHNIGGKIVEKVGDAMQWAGTKIGMTFSIDPSPVRVSIGESWDIEPMVITGLTIKPSKETFIEPTTHAHLPITVDATIGLDYWLTPRAGQENMSIAGQEIFGWLQEERHTEVIKNTEKYVNEKNKNMWDTLSQGKLNSNASNRRGMNM